MIFSTQHMIIVAIAIIALAVLFGIFKTKTQGFGKFTTSIVILILVVSIGALLLADDRIDRQQMVSLLFTVAGFAGGLIAGKD